MSVEEKVALVNGVRAVDLHGRDGLADADHRSCLQGLSGLGPRAYNRQ